MTNKQEKQHPVVLRYYQLQKKIGEGAFGEIFLAVNRLDNSQVAVKIQNAQSQGSQLFQESRLIMDLTTEHEVNIPNVHNVGKEGNCYIMVLDLLGESLESVLSLCKRNKVSLSLQTIVRIGLQMLHLIEYIHEQGVLHRDIKPDNFLLGRGENANKIFMIDFGLAKRYKDKDGRHIAYRDNKDLTGTARYASVNTHLGIEQGRRDDLESFIYVLLYLYLGSLPWQSMRGLGKKEKYERIMERKLTIPFAALTQGLPQQFQLMLRHVRSLHFQQKPNYDLLKTLLREIADQNSLRLEGVPFEWERINRGSP